MSGFILFIFIVITTLVAGLIVYIKTTNQQPAENLSMNQNNQKPAALAGKKILMVIAFNDFKDEEYFVPKEIFERAGAAVVTVSTQTGTAHGADGGETEVQLSVGAIQELPLQEFIAIVFVGGPGMAQQLDNADFQKLAQEAKAADKLVAAICIAPAMLAKAGVLQDKNATVWSSPLDKSAVKVLNEKGAHYQDEPVVQDGKIITANGPAAAKEFAEIIIQQLSITF